MINSSTFNGSGLNASKATVISGALAASETNKDTAKINGTNSGAGVRTGNLAISESGKDTLYINGYVPAELEELEGLIRRSTLPTFIELFRINLSTITGQTSVYKFTPMFNTNNPGDGHIVWGGENYLPFPISISGIGFSVDDAPSRPTLNIANINKLFGMLTFTVQDVIGAEVTYIRTFEQYIGGDGALSAPPLKFFIARKTAHNLMNISFELRSPVDKERAFFPKRQMLKTEFPGLGTNKVAQ